MKYTVKSGEHATELEITGPEEALEITGAHGSESASVDLLGNDHYVLRMGERVLDGFVTPVEDGYLVVFQGRTYEVAIEDDRARALAQFGNPKHRAASGTIKAPMPGLVKAVHVAVGDEVKRGTSLVILEAMKMENDLTAPGPGVVKEINVEPGAKVDQGQALVIIE